MREQERIELRTKAKAEAAKTMEADAKKAQKAKDKAQGKAIVIEGQADFLKRAKEIEQSINKPAEDTEESS